MNRNLTKDNLQEIRILDKFIESLSPNIFWLLDNNERNIISYMSDMLKIKRGLVNHIIPDKYPKIKITMDGNTRELVLPPADVIELMENFFENDRVHIKVSSKPKDLLNGSLYWGISNYSRYFIAGKTEGLFITHEYGKLLANLVSGYKCLEVGSRTGIISKLLQDNDVECICTGDKDDERVAEWTDITEIDPFTSIEVYGGEVDYIIVHYSQIDCKFADKMLSVYINLMHDANPDCKLVVIGDSEFPNLQSEPTIAEKIVMMDINNLYIDKYNSVDDWASNHVEIYK